MSGIPDTSSKVRAKRDEGVDKRAFGQVEKWMTMIREIDQEPETEHEPADRFDLRRLA